MEVDMLHSCRCCLRCPPDNDLTTPYTHLGLTETYADMLQQCFDIHLVLADEGSPGICSACVGRLRDASDFKLLVQRSQAELQAALLVKGLRAHFENGWTIGSEKKPVEKLEMVDDHVSGGVSDEEHLLPEMDYVSDDDSSGAGVDEEHLLSPEMDVSGDDSSGACVVYMDDCDDRAREQIAMGCSVVLERLRSDAERISNTSIYNAKEPYACEDCNQRFSSKSVLLRHIRHTHVSPDVKQLPCNFCSSTFKIKLSLIEHEKSEHGVTNFMCAECEYTTVSKQHLRAHLKSHTVHKTFDLRSSSTMKRSKENFQEHQIKRIGKKLYKCNICDYKCLNFSNLRTHKMTHTDDKFQCSYCTHKFMQKTDLQRHQMIHTGAKPFECSDCDYKCRRKENLLIHQRTHTGEKPYKCDRCDYKSRDKSTLRKHQMRHTNKKPLQCSLCDYKSIWKTNLRTHQMKHTGAKPFKCSNCDFKCSQKTNLRVHQRIHTGEKPYECNQCDYKCRQKEHLQKHQRVHTREKLSAANAKTKRSM